MKCNDEEILVEEFYMRYKLLFLLPRSRFETYHLQQVDQNHDAPFCVLRFVQHLSLCGCWVIWVETKGDSI